MKDFKTVLSLLITLVLISACQPSFDYEKETEQLLALNRLQREAHMENDAVKLVSQMADSLITVDGGNIYQVSNAQVLEQFSRQFKTVKYHKWDDIRVPVIHLSPEGNHATISVQKMVIIERLTGKIDTTTFAWTSAYQKEAKLWKMYSITSTDDR